MATSKLTQELILQLFTVKSLKNMIQDGHNIAQCTVYFKGKLIAKFFDDGLGGGAQIEFKSPATEKIFNDFAEEYGLQQFVSDDWELGDINQNDMFTYVTDKAINEVNRLKHLTKIDNLCKKAIVFGTDMRYSNFAWKGVKSLPDLLKYNNGLKLLQEAYDEAKSRLQGDMKIFNTEEQLKALGIKL